MMPSTYDDAVDPSKVEIVYHFAEAMKRSVRDVCDRREKYTDHASIWQLEMVQRAWLPINKVQIGAKELIGSIGKRF